MDQRHPAVIAYASCHPHSTFPSTHLLGLCLPAELTMRRVVVGILLMILLLPGLDVDYGLWGRYIGVDRGGLSMLHDIAVYGGGNGTAAFAQALQVCCTCAVACSLRCNEHCVLKAGQSWCRSVRCCGCVLT